ncbi:MAG: hypothetical protein HY649_00810 [Acidobacteria bacterium]|nr:hypothetical protein [Acidobacteriota bacterium]
MTSDLRRAMGCVMAGLALVLVSWPALADTQFQVRKMTRGDVPLGNGQCDIRLRVDGEAEVSVRGDTVLVRTISGRDARDDGSECNEPLPARAVDGFNFEVRDSRGDIVLLSEPVRRTDFRAVVRIRDSEGGEGRYHFRLNWAMDGGGFRPGPGPDPGYDRGDWPRGGAASLGSAVDACGEAVAARIARDYRLSDVVILNARIDTPSGRGDYVVSGEAIGRQGRSTQTFSYTCRADSNSGRARTVDLRRR